jgi:hypothetical protein
MPTSVAQVTNHRTISRRRQFKEASVMRITWEHGEKSSVKRKFFFPNFRLGAMVEYVSLKNKNKLIITQCHF